MTCQPEGRWNDPFLAGGEEFASFWQAYLGGRRRDLMVILGVGFDRRMIGCAEVILAVGGEGARDCIGIEYDEGPGSHSQNYVSSRESNRGQLSALFAKRGEVTTREVRMFADDGRRVGSRSIVRAFDSLDEFREYSDVLVDISALPRSLYFPLLAKLLTLFDRAGMGLAPNLHVLVAHSPEIDGGIRSDGVDETAAFVLGFPAATFEREATREVPRVWIPLLGRGQGVQMERIHERVTPDEICPVVPCPAANPREADELILEYRELLFDQLLVEPQNIIHASESNPFEVYRELTRSIGRYNRALAPLGGCKAVLSAMSSKLLSVGALLCAYELSASGSDSERVDVGVAHVDCQGYRVLSSASEQASVTLYSMWLCGECYGE